MNKSCSSLAISSIQEEKKQLKQNRVRTHLTWNLYLFPHCSRCFLLFVHEDSCMCTSDFTPAQTEENIRTEGRLKTVWKKQETSRAKWMSNLNSCACRMIFSKELTMWGISVWKYTAVIKNTWTAASYASDDFMHLCVPKCVKPAIYNITQGHVALSMLNI